MSRTQLKKRHFITMLAPNPGVVLSEHLRYAGAIGFYDVNHPSYIEPEVKNLFKLNVDDALVTFECPDGPSVNGVGAQYEWGRMQLNRLESFDVAAVWWTRDNYGLVTVEPQRQTPAVNEMFVDRLAQELAGGWEVR